MTIRAGKLFFIHIPKTAGTSISHHLKNCSVLNGKDYQSRLHGSKHWTYEQLTRHIQHPDQYNFFTVVRNPYDRIVSGYYYYKTGARATSAKGLPESFAEFVRGEWDKDWGCVKKAQSTYVESDVHILHFENLQADYDKFIKLYVGDVDTKLKITNSSQATESRPWARESKDFETYYTDELKEIVYNRHKSDFELFGYPK